MDNQKEKIKRIVLENLHKGTLWRDNLVWLDLKDLKFEISRDIFGWYVFVYHKDAKNKYIEGNYYNYWGWAAHALIETLERSKAEKDKISREESIRAYETEAQQKKRKLNEDIAKL